MHHGAQKKGVRGTWRRVALEKRKGSHPEIRENIFKGNCFKEGEIGLMNGAA